MEIIVVLAILGVIFFGPLAIALIALTRVRGLRLRLEDTERFVELRVQRLVDRVNRVDPGPVEAAPHQPPAPPPVVRVESAPKRPESIPYMPAVALKVRPAVVVRPAPVAIEIKPQPPAPEAPKERMPLENLIGERILPRVGVIAIVLGMALLVWYSYTHLGPKGKLALAGVTGALMVGGGVALRRHAYTLLLGGCLIGGGWAVLYITGYAAHAVEASRVITSPLLGFIVLIAISEAALLHALRYKSETITGLAYLLTIATLLISPHPAPAAWVAIGLSSAVLVALAWKFGWIRLCVVGAKLLYVAEAVWLSRTPPAEITIALAALGVMWFMWILPDYFHRPKTEGAKRFHGLLVAVNFGGLLVSAALIQKWFNLVHMGWVWMILGALYAMHAVAGRKAAWRPAYLASLAFGALFFFIGSHQQFAGIGPVFAWMAASVALVAWGMWNRDEIPFYLGVAGLIATLIRFWGVDRGLDYAFAPGLAIPGLLYAVSAIIARRRIAEVAEPLSHLAAIALGMAIWRYAPQLSTATLFAWTGVAFLLLALRSKARWLMAQGLVFLTIPVYFLAYETLTATGDIAGVSLRLATTIPVLLAWLLAGHLPNGEKNRGFFSVILFGGVLATLAFELTLPQVPVAWALAAGAWFAWSRLTRRDLEFMLAAGGAVGSVLMLATSPVLLVPATGWTGPVASGAVLTAIWLAIHLVSGRGSAGPAGSIARDVFAVAIAATVFTLLGRQSEGMPLIGSWAVLGFALAAYGLQPGDRVSRWTSMVVLGAALMQAVVVATPQAAATWALVSGGWFLWSRFTKRDAEFIFATLAAAGGVLLYAASPTLLVPAVAWTGPVASGALLVGIFLAIHLASRNAHACFRDAFAAAIAVTGFMLLAREMTGTWLTGSWAILGFALAAYGFLVRDRVSRWSSLIVLAVCLGKVAIFDFARFDMPVRIATLITLGAVMVALSFVYARHHRRIVVYLAGKE